MAKRFGAFQADTAPSWIVDTFIGVEESRVCCQFGALLIYMARELFYSRMEQAVVDVSVISYDADGGSLSLLFTLRSVFMFFTGWWRTPGPPGECVVGRGKGGGGHSPPAVELQYSVKEVMELKGQMIHLPESNSIMFLGSPRVDRLEELMGRGLHLSDIPIHDATRDVILLEHPHTVPADGAVGVEVEGHQVF
ncbi:hypothetical protein NFI96_006371 [Prochilodus magdalenae]|nr:hypothetical protein NFI96_006371 [Prochilodus magdalenae]